MNPQQQPPNSPIPPPAQPDPGEVLHLPTSRLGRLFIALTNRDFRFIWVFYILNYLGMTIEMLAMGWMVLEITDSAFWVGGVAGLRGAGQVLFGIVAGVIVDRFNRRMILVVVQLVRAVLYLLLAILLLSNSIELWHIMVSTLLLGMLMATVLPSGEALIYDTVGPRRILNAVAITHGAFSIARIPGSILAGFLIDQWGLGYSYVAMTIVMLLAPIPILFISTRQQRAPSAGGIWKNAREGLAYASRSPSIRTLLLFSSVVELFGFSYFVMLPVIAREVLDVGASGLGLPLRRGQYRRRFRHGRHGRPLRVPLQGTPPSHHRRRRGRVPIPLRLPLLVRFVPGPLRPRRPLSHLLRRHHGRTPSAPLHRPDARPHSRPLQPHLRLHPPSAASSAASSPPSPPRESPSPRAEPSSWPPFLLS